MRRRKPAVFAVLGITLLAACSSWHRTPSAVEGVTHAKSGEIHVTRLDGSMVRLVNASIVGDSIVGVSPVTGARLAIPTTAVAYTETKEISAGRTALLGGGVVLGIVALSAILLVAALAASLGG